MTDRATVLIVDDEPDLCELLGITLARMDLERWNLTIDVNLSAILDLTHALEDLIADHGRIVALSSVSGIAGNFGQTNYSTSKAAVIGFIEAAATRYGSRGITVNGIAPTVVRTEMARHWLENPETRKQILGRIPLGRVADPKDPNRVRV